MFINSLINLHYFELSIMKFHFEDHFPSEVKGTQNVLN